jgi:hypothetical protein
VDHAAAHRDGVSQHFIGDAELLERVNPARREREIDRSSADNIAFARIGPSLVKIDIVPAPPQVRAEQSASEAAADENKFRFIAHEECLTADYADIMDLSTNTLEIPTKLST